MQSAGFQPQDYVMNISAKLQPQDLAQAPFEEEKKMPVEKPQERQQLVQVEAKNQR